ncbi:MAG: sugar phosphorylase [Pseudomonadota bacterium]
MQGAEKIRKRLIHIYGQEKGNQACKRIYPILESFPAKAKVKKEYFSEKDIVLITYGDSLQSADASPLETLCLFAVKQLKNRFSAIHILPFYPYSSDDGFSVIDFFTVNPELGTWEEIQQIGDHFELMFDFVVNHISSKSEWFSRYLAEEKGFEDLAIEADPSMDLSGVTRPRSLPLLTEYRKRSGEPVWVWTTFSADQIDLNFNSMNVLEKMVKVLLHYIDNGARMIRMDAIAYLWKQIGTSCIHLPTTHEMVKLFRDIFDLTAPDVINLTETNVPHDENISYFGNGKDEAQMVYNFTLPPLLFYTFVKGNTSILSGWAKKLVLVSSDNTFFNFTASHDGIGVRPLEGILPKGEIDDLIDIVKKNGGQVSCRQNADGSESPYELNITYVDAMWHNMGKPDPYHAERFLASQSIMLCLPGVPAIYIHSLLGSRNWEEGFRKTGRARTINREKLNIQDVFTALDDDGSFRSRVFFPYMSLIAIRRSQPAFHPNALFEVLDIHEKVFVLKRSGKGQTIFSITNVTEYPVRLAWMDDDQQVMKDLLNGQVMHAEEILLAPYQYRWLVPKQ